MIPMNMIPKGTDDKPCIFVRGTHGYPILGANLYPKHVSEKLLGKGSGFVPSKPM